MKTDGGCKWREELVITVWQPGRTWTMWCTTLPVNELRQLLTKKRQCYEINDPQTQKPTIPRLMSNWNFWLTEQSKMIFELLTPPYRAMNSGLISTSRGLQRDVVSLGWPIAPSYMSPNAGGGGGALRGLSQWVQLYTWSPNKLWKVSSLVSTTKINGQWFSKTIIFFMHRRRILCNLHFPLYF